MVSTSTKLRELRLKQPSYEDLILIKRQIVNEINDRGAAVLASTLVEGALRHAISQHLDPSFSKLGSVFDNNGPMSSFDNRIISAEALGIIGTITTANLKLIKEVRNTFAHSSTPITFLTEEIAEACHGLADEPGANFTYQSDRNRFIAFCYATTAALQNYASAYHQARANSMPPDEIVPMKPRPLP